MGFKISMVQLQLQNIRSDGSVIWQKVTPFLAIFFVLKSILKSKISAIYRDAKPALYVVFDAAGIF